MARGQSLLPHRQVCRLAPSHLWVPGAPSSCWTLHKQKLWVGSHCLFRSKRTTCFSMMGNGLHILLYYQLLLKLKFSVSWLPAPTVFHSISQKQLHYTQEEQSCWEEHDDSPTVHWPRPRIFRSKLYKAENLPRFRCELSQHYPPNPVLIWPQFNPPLRGPQ